MKKKAVNMNNIKAMIMKMEKVEDKKEMKGGEYKMPKKGTKGGKGGGRGC